MRGNREKGEPGILYIVPTPVGNLEDMTFRAVQVLKEADLILSKGWRNADMLLGTSHEFTRDIFCFWHDEEGFQARFRPRAAEAHKFSAQDIADLADVVITRMRQAHGAGRAVL